MKTQRLTRSLTDRVLGGVCGGLAGVIGVNAWWLRAAFTALAAFTAGAGALFYLALWWLLPPQRLAALPRSGYAAEAAPRLEAIALIGIAVIASGLVVLARNLDVVRIGSADAFAPAVVIAFGAVMLLKQLRRTP